MKFKVGDSVIILQGKNDFNNEMHSFIGKTVKITATDGTNVIRFHKDGGWAWKFNNGHFKLKNKTHELW